MTVFGIKITKGARIPKRKIDISSNLNGIFNSFKLELFIDVSWKLLRCEINVHEKTIYKIRNNQNLNSTKLYGYTDHLFTAYKRPLCAIEMQGHLYKWIRCPKCAFKINMNKKKDNLVWCMSPSKDHEHWKPSGDLMQSLVKLLSGTVVWLRIKCTYQSIYTCM